MTSREVALLFAGLALLALAQTYLMFATFAYMTGWRRLAKRYPYRRCDALPPLGPTQGVMLDAWGWNAPPMRLGYDGDGIVLRPLAPFRPTFAIVRLPWSAVRSVERQTSFHGDVTLVRFGPAAREILRFLPSGLDKPLAERMAGGNLRRRPEVAGRIRPSVEM